MPHTIAVVGGLAAFGTFNPIMNFPLVFGGVCLALGWFNLWRNQATVRAAPWAPPQCDGHDPLPGQAAGTTDSQTH